MGGFFNLRSSGLGYRNKTAKSALRQTISSSATAVNEELEARLLLSGTSYIVDSLSPDIAHDGFTTLPEAIRAANTNDIITFADSLFDDGPVTLNGDLFNITLNNLQIIGPGSDLLTLEAHDDSTAISVIGQSSLSGMTLTGYEQAAFLRSVQLTLSDVHFVNCDQGIHIMLSDLTMENCLITGCSEPYLDTNFGAIYALRSNLILRSSIVSDNHYESNEETVRGGGIYFDGGGYNNLQIIDSSISNNSADYGGGIYTYDKFTMIGGELSGNTASYDGGGAFLDGSEEYYFDSVSIANNLATDNGGAIYGGTESCILDIYNCDVIANRANRGGAISSEFNENYNEYSFDYNFGATISSSRFYANYANTNGGAFYGVNLLINNSALVGNEAGVCGGVFAATDDLFGVNNTIVDNHARIAGGAFSCDAELYNCIIAMNTANGTLNDIDQSGLFSNTDFELSGDYNIVGAIDITPIDGNNNIGGAADQPMDPMFTANPDPGESGWTNSLGTPWIDETYDNFYGDLSPLEGSPAIATTMLPVPTAVDGQHTYSAKLFVKGQTVLCASDAGGNARWLGAGIDIGAFEYAGESETPVAEILINGYATGPYFYISPLLEAGDTSTLSLTVKNTGEMVMYDTITQDNYWTSLAATDPQAEYTTYITYTLQTDGEAPHTLILYTNDFNNPEFNLTPIAAPIGDADLSGDVSLDDFILLKQNYGQTVTDEKGWTAGDFNGDLQINLDDFILLKQNYGTAATTPATPAAPAAPAAPATSQAASAAPNEPAALAATDEQIATAVPQLNIADLTWSPPVKLIAIDSNFDCLAAALIVQSTD